MGRSLCAQATSSQSITCGHRCRDAANLARLCEDVYKRQLLSGEVHLRLVDRLRPPHGSVGNEETTRRLLKTWLAVSYTHLDVYKRQPRTRVNPGCWSVGSQAR